VISSFGLSIKDFIFGLSIKDDYVDLSSLYWIPKLRKCPCKERYIAGSAKCSTKSLSKLLTTVLSTVRDGLQIYCDTAYSRNGINQIWILKFCIDLEESLNSQSLYVITSIKTFDFSTLYTRSEERRVGKGVDLGGRRIIKKKKEQTVILG